MASRSEICARVDAILEGCRDLPTEVERYRHILAACRQLEHEGWDSKAVTVVREGACMILGFEWERAARN